MSGGTAESCRNYVYLKMIGREQKECTVGGGETSWSRGADGVSQTDISVLTHW